jgi:glycosyltransferase involved in cell wall biosynthesis
MADPRAAAVTVAIPVRDGAATLPRVLAALARQTVDHELLICDSGSRDGSLELARSSDGARVITIAPAQFGHGRTRNLLMSEAAGAHVAFLTQDAEPAGERWLEELLGGFALADDVGLVYGPYRPRPDAPRAVRGELRRWFDSLSPDGRPVVERLEPRELERAQAVLLGRRGFFTDANSCIARAAWERVRFRDIPSAEDRALALDMMTAGFAKAFVPAAAVVHSHDYGPLQQLRRSFDEARALREVFGWREPSGPGQLARRLRGELRAAFSESLHEGLGTGRAAATLAPVATHELMRSAGTMLGSRAGTLPERLRRALSHERRGEAPVGPEERSRR